MDIPLVGGSEKGYSPDYNCYRTVNMTTLKVNDSEESPSVLIPSPGLKEIYDLQANGVRGIARISNSNNTVYVVSDDKVCKLTINTVTETCEYKLLGTLGTSTGVIKFANNPTQLIIADGGTGAIITLATDAFEPITDPDYPKSSAIMFYDSYFVGNRPGTGQMQTSDLLNGASWDALDVATAENKPDNVVGFAQSRGEVWVFGNESIEVWEDTANPEGFPFTPRVSGALTQGCSAPYSIVEVNGIIVWLDDRKLIVQNGVSTYLKDQSSGFVASIISTEAVNAAIASYSVVSDAIGMTYTDRGHTFYQITFPTARKTWLWDFFNQVWTEKAYYSNYSNSYVEHLAQFSVPLNNTNIVGGVTNGKIYIMDSRYKTDNGAPIHRIRTVGPFRLDRRWISIDEVWARLDTGEALQNGYGSDPQIMLRYSTNGGHTWSNELMRPLGKTGEYALPITWTCLGTAREWVFEFKITTPIDFTFISAVAEVTVENKRIDKVS